MTFPVAKAEVCGAPFVALVGYSEKHIDKVGKFGDGMEPDDGLPGGGGTDAVKNVCYGFGQSGWWNELVTDEEAVKASRFGGIKGVTVEMRFCRRQVEVEVVGVPLATDVSDLGGGAFDLTVDEFKKELELGGYEAQFDEFGGNGIGRASLQVTEELSEGD